LGGTALQFGFELAEDFVALAFLALEQSQGCADDLAGRLDTVPDQTRLWRKASSSGDEGVL
jgi:hypothetical protein